MNPAIFRLIGLRLDDHGSRHRPLSGLHPARRLVPALLLTLLAWAAAAAPISAQAPDPSGSWEGAIEIPGTPLAISLDLSRAGEAWSGSISIPQQGARDVPLINISVDEEIAFTIGGVPGDPTFRGQLSAAGDTLSGQFHQAGQAFPFTLVQVEDPGQQAVEALAGFDEWIVQALEDFDVPGAAVGVFSNGQVILTEGYGVRDREAGLPVDAETLFAIGSSTKAFTTFGLALLADEGRFDWDRSVRSWLPEVEFSDPVATRQVTLRDMVTHRTGLPRHDLVWYARDDYSSDVLIESLPHLEPNRELRELWQYNNLMYILAGHLLGEIDGTSWEEAVQARILDPLGMASTQFSVEASQASPNHALPHGMRADTLARIPFRDIRAVGPAGSINSNVRDMLRWIEVQVGQGQIDGEVILSPAALRELHTPQVAIPALPNDGEIGPMSYAMGWFVEPFRGHFRVHHGGNIDGFSALVTLFPMDGMGIVVLTNRNGTPLPGMVAQHLADRLLDLEPRDWTSAPLQAQMASAQIQREASERLDGERVEGTRPHHALERYAARYRHPGYGELEIVLDGDSAGDDGIGQGLTVRFNGLSAPLQHWHHEVFSATENPEDPTLHRRKFQFQSDLRGRVTAVSVPFEPALEPLRFERLPDQELSDPAYLARFVGDYDLGPQRIQIRIRGDRLTMELPGQPLYEMDPDRDDSFVFADLAGYSISFELEEDGAVVAIVLHQPNGVFRAQRVR